MSKFKIILNIAIIVPIMFITEAYGQKDYYFNLSEIFPIHDFQLQKNQQYEIVALNKAGEPDRGIEGIYTFVMNGYIEKLNFSKGIAPLKSNFEDYSVLYIKHEVEGKSSIQHVFYTLSGNTFRIPFWTFLLLPILILILAFVIKRMIMLLLIVLFIAFFLVQGLDWNSLVEVFKLSLDWVKQIF